MPFSSTTSLPESPKPLVGAEAGAARPVVALVASAEPRPPEAAVTRAVRVADPAARAEQAGGAVAVEPLPVACSIQIGMSAKMQLKVITGDKVRVMPSSRLAYERYDSYLHPNVDIYILVIYIEHKFGTCTYIFLIMH